MKTFLNSPRGSRFVSLLLALVAVAWPTHARAYPQWQLAAGMARCNQCHVAPAGGGLLSTGGRQILGDELSSFSSDGGLLHGAAQLPTWLALGADLRGAYVSQVAQDGNRPTPAGYPAEGEAEALFSVGHLALYGTLTMRGQLRSEDAMVPLQNYQPAPAAWLVSREHWLMWRPGSQPGGRGPYLRAGRFFAPFGLQLAEHMAFIRRDLGFNELEESYNLSAGFLSDRWEGHATAFAPDVVRHFGGQESGVAAYVERRFLGGAGAWAVQAKYARRTGVTRTIGGVVGKYYVASIRTLLLAEVDTVLLAIDNLRARGQAVGALEATVFPARGLRISALGEHYQEDLEVRDAARSAGTVLIGWLPYAHFEGQVLGRVEFPAGGAIGKTVFAQLHYFL